MLLRTILLLILTLFSVQGFSQNLTESSTVESTVIQLPSDRGVVTIATEVLGDISLEQADHVITERHQKNDTVVVSDLPQVLEKSAPQMIKKENSKAFRFMPVGALAHYKEHQARVQKTIQTDKVSVIVITIGTAVDSLVWIHATSLDFPQKISMVSLNILMAVTLGLDRELWGKITIPVENRILRVLDYLSGTTNEKFKTGKEMASQFMSNFALGSSLYLARTSLLSFQNLHHTLSSMSFWAHSLKMMVAATATHFTWSVIYNKTNEDLNPIAKLNLKRAADVRYVILAVFASMSMVMQPEVYGHTPIITYVIHGSLGLMAWLSAEKLIEFLETNAVSKKIYKSTIRFETFMNTMRQRSSNAPAGAALSCQSLFL